MHSSDSSFCVINYETNLIELNKKHSKASALETKYLRKGYFFPIIVFLFHIIRILFLKPVCVYKLSVINLQESITLLNQKS